MRKNSHQRTLWQRKKDKTTKMSATMQVILILILSYLKSTAKPNKISRIPSKCHHENPHNCHQYECPPCNQLCLLPNDTTNCEHLCQVKCHDAVKVSFIDKNFKPAGPWEKQVERVSHFIKISS